MSLDNYTSYVVAAFGISALGLGLYTAYLWSRLAGLRRQLPRDPNTDSRVAPDPVMTG